MKRRDFLKKAGVVAGSTAFSPLMFANAQAATYRWGMVTSWPTSLDTLYGSAQALAQTVSDLTEGQLEIQVYPAGAQVGGLEVYDAVASGAFQMGHTASYYYINKDPAQAFFTAVPFGLTAQQQNAWFYNGGGLELWQELSARDNMIVFPAGNTGTQMGGWFRKEINTPADLQGLTMRIAGLGGEVMSRAGVNVQQLPGGEIFLALDTGVLDATEWVGPYDDSTLGLNNAATYYYGPAWQEFGAAFGAYINLDEYNALPAPIQNALRYAASSENVRMLSKYEALNGPALQQLRDSGTEVRTFSKEIIDVLRGHADAMFQDLSGQSEFFAKVLPQWSAFRDSVRSWNQVGEYQAQRIAYDDL